ncbi:MAG: hypothetical protein KGZ79_15135 [Dethiobacter sp.]|jgi:hypothetical protein|nr:hypothetical protein [Dethiobacter sp.]
MRKLIAVLLASLLLLPLSALAEDAAVTESGEILAQSVPATITIDVAGNREETKTLTVKSDTSPPLLDIKTPQPYAVLPVGTALDYFADDSVSGLLHHSLTISLQNCLGDDAFTEDINHSGGIMAAGVYRLIASVSDIAGNFAEEIREFVVYDPEGGFVTGSGWIDSPAGAFMAQPSLSGKASFGFVSKYHKGATIPKGETIFQFRACGLNFQYRYSSELG